MCYILLRIVIFLLAFNSLYSQQRYEMKVSNEQYLLLSVAKEIGLKEVGVSVRTKHGREQIKKYLKSVRLGYYNPFCASGQYWTRKEAQKLLKPIYGLIKIPDVRSGLANRHYAWIRDKGYKTEYLAKLLDYLIWKYAKSSHGHIELVIEVHPKGWVTTLAFNVDKRSVKIKKRCLTSKLGRMSVRGLVGYEKPNLFNSWFICRHISWLPFSFLYCG